MARLPEPIMEEINATWDEDYPLREKSFSSILGQAVRKAKVAENLKNKGEGTNIKSD